MTFDLTYIFGTLVHVHSIQVTFVGQNHKLKYKPRGKKNVFFYQFQQCGGKANLNWKL